ncbi:MAG: hypothetical protein AAFY59_01460 [Pseudomonadota bacterium]
MLGLITFSGRLSRIGWLVNLALIGGILYAWVWPRLDNLFRLNDEINLENTLEQEILAGLLVALYILISSAIRRLRDAGSPVPLLELLIGALIPGLGQLWLALRLFLWGPAGQEAPSPQTPAKGRTTPDIWVRNQNDRPARSRPHLPKRAPKTPAPDNPTQIVRRHSSDTTVIRTRRRLFTGARRIGF